MNPSITRSTASAAIWSWSSNSSGLRTDDEAFKKAFTDAIGNAMKHLGMSADVHMGLFDDSKYVESVREELASAAPAFTEPDTKAKSRENFAVIMDALRTAGNKRGKDPAPRVLEPAPISSKCSLEVACQRTGSSS